MIQTTKVGEMTAEVKNIDFMTLSHENILDGNDDIVFKRRRSVIMATLANRAVTDVDIQKMMESGLNVVRFRMSYQSGKDRIKLLKKIKKAADVCCQKSGLFDWPIATCIDLKARTVKTGLLEAEDVPYITLKKDTEIQLTCDVAFYNKCNDRTIFVDNPDLATEVKVGMAIAIDSDEINLVCTEIVNAKCVKAVIVKSGALRDICCVAFRGLETNRPFLTKRDQNIIKFAIEQQIDGIIVPCENADEIKMVKKCIGKKVRRPVLLGGISSLKAMMNIDEILKESDGIIVMRENLRHEVPASYTYRINNIQKWITAKCLQAGKPVYLSGGVLQTAVRQGVLKINEISDVTNAILDGVSGFILKDCEDIDNAIEAVKQLDLLCRCVEPFTCIKTTFWRLTDQYKLPVNAAEASVLSCVALANQTNSQVIVLPTVTGRTAKALIQMRPCCLILAVCTNVRVTRMLQIFKGIVPLLYQGAPLSRYHLTTSARTEFALDYAVKMGWLHYGDTYAVLQRSSDCSSYCDMVAVLSVHVSSKPLVDLESSQNQELVPNSGVHLTTSARIEFALDYAVKMDWLHYGETYLRCFPWLMPSILDEQTRTEGPISLVGRRWGAPI